MRVSNAPCMCAFEAHGSMDMYISTNPCLYVCVHTRKEIV
jgi:hypothetical protein